MIGSRPALTLVALLSLAVAACSSGPAAPTLAPGATPVPPGATQAPLPTANPGGGTTELPCEAIQPDVAAAAAKPLQTHDFTGGRCVFNFGENADVPGLDGVINIRLEQQGKTDLRVFKLAFPGGDDVSGLGDSAYWAKDADVMYAAFRGNIYAVQLVLFSDTDDTKTIATKTMQALLSHV